MRPRRPPPYTTGREAAASAWPRLSAAVAYIASAPGDDAQLCVSSRSEGSLQDADGLAGAGGEGRRGR